MFFSSYLWQTSGCRRVNRGAKAVAAWTVLLRMLAWACLWIAPVSAQVASPHAIDIPKWFANSLLDFQDEVAEAKRDGKRVMVYFGQDGCPYCKALMKANFGPGPITDKTRRHFTAVALNIWGDLDVTWIDGRKATEKALARQLNVQFTPTLLFLDTDGKLLLRLNGYQPPERFTHVLDWVIERRDRELSLAEFLEQRLPAAARAAGSGAASASATATATAAAAPTTAGASPRYLLRDPSQLARAGRGRPLAVLFESPSCGACAELHAEAFTRTPMQPLLRAFDIARLQPGQPMPLVTPDGRRSDSRAWARDLGIVLYPTVVLFDAQGREAFRFDGLMRPFHVESAFDYVASGAHRSEPQFQRFVQARAQRLEAAGRSVDLWK